MGCESAVFGRPRGSGNTLEAADESSMFEFIRGFCSSAAFCTLCRRSAVRVSVHGVELVSKTVFFVYDPKYVSVDVFLCDFFLMLF